MSNEQWSLWIPWFGGECPLNSDVKFQVRLEDGCEYEGYEEDWDWSHDDLTNMDIIAYRYRLDDNTMTPEEEEIPAQKWDGYVDADDTVPTSIKQLRYQDAKGEDWIDEFARTASIDEFRGAMKFTIGKYNRRAGKKDALIQEIEKMRDYCDRWIEYERTL